MGQHLQYRWVGEGLKFGLGLGFMHQGLWGRVGESGFLAEGLGVKEDWGLAQVCYCSHPAGSSRSFIPFMGRCGKTKPHCITTL